MIIKSKSGYCKKRQKNLMLYSMDHKKIPKFYKTLRTKSQRMKNLRKDLKSVDTERRRDPKCQTSYL